MADEVVFEDLTELAKDDDITEFAVLTAIDQHGIVTWEEFQNKKIFAGLSSSQQRLRALGTALRSLKGKGYVEIDKTISPTAHKITKTGTRALVRMRAGQTKEAQKEEMDLELTKTTIVANKQMIRTANRALVVSTLSLIVAAVAVLISLKPQGQALIDWLRSLFSR